MARYSYKARDQQDRILTGTMEGASVDEVLDRLSIKDLVPVSVDELNFDGTPKNRGFWDKLNESILSMQSKVPYRTVVFFTRQIATMLEGGVPLSRSLEQLAKSEKPVFRKIIMQVAEDIGIGHTFSDAIAKHPGAFNNMYVAAVRSGEVSGALDVVLDQLATYMEDIEAMKSKIKAAMRYPLFIGAFVVVLIIGILWKLVPTFQNVYETLGGTLPKPTQVLVFASNLIQKQMPLVIILLVAAVVGFKMGLTVPSFKFFVDKQLFKVPVFGGIIRKNIFANFCRTMALLMDSGTPILEAIQIAGAVVNNSLYARALEEVYGNLRQGELLSAALEKTRQFPVLITQLVGTGEESGRIDALLRKAAEFYEREIRNVVDSLAAIIEPFLIITLGGVVGAILIALYFPIFTIGKLVKG
ncbi:MAG: type II secretion system F family protein [Chitinispirillaceae bacterium]|nr:type II secretion system F family protein [Chitinispirillaceae bacterium]